MWLAGARLQQCSWAEVDSDDTAQDVHLNHSLPKQPFMAQIRGTGMARHSGHSPASRAQGSRVWQRKASMPQPSTGV